MNRKTQFLGMSMSSIPNLFDLTGKVAVITGGAGLLGRQHARAISAFGGMPVILDIDYQSAHTVAKEVGGLAFECDVTNPTSIGTTLIDVISSHGHVDILVNNVSCNANIETLGIRSRLEYYSYAQWKDDLELGLSSAFLCSKIIGGYMARAADGVVVNIASDLSVIAPDQRLYRKDGLEDDEQPAKPVSYSVVKHGIIGLTRYLATYWAGKVRVNALSPGGVRNNQPDEFVRRVSNLIPMGRMADVSEMQGALVFLCSGASGYMTGQNLVIDGGRSS